MTNMILFQTSLLLSNWIHGFFLPLTPCWKNDATASLVFTFLISAHDTILPLGTLSIKYFPIMGVILFSGSDEEMFVWIAPPLRSATGTIPCAWMCRPVNRKHLDSASVIHLRRVLEKFFRRCPMSTIVHINVFARIGRRLKSDILNRSEYMIVRKFAFFSTCRKITFPPMYCRNFASAVT